MSDVSAELDGSKQYSNLFRLQIPKYIELGEISHPVN